MDGTSKKIQDHIVIKKITEDSLMSAATDETTSADILHEIAESDLSSTKVREAVASNTACSTETNLYLCDDEEADIRIALAKKAANICSPKNPSDQSINKSQALTFLRKLAADAEVSVRQTLAEEIKESDHIPAEIAQTLARDVVESVAMPVLEYSPLLEDEDLLEIISSKPKTGLLCAISKRSTVSENVSDSLVETRNQAVIPSLLKNANAQIREDTLNQIVEAAENNQGWQAALITRSKLPASVSKRIEKYISVELINHLHNHGHVDVEGAKHLMGRVKERLGKTVSVPAHRKMEQSVKRQRSVFSKDETFLVEAIENRNREAVFAEISHRTKLKALFVRRAFISKNAKVITALCWKSGFSANLAYMVQTKVSSLEEHVCIPPSESNKYALTEKEMNWHLEVFGANRPCNIK